jgi:hypothetical protein
MDQSPKQRRCGQLQKLSRQQLTSKLNAPLSNSSSSMTFLHLIDHYDFDLDDLENYQLIGLYFYFSSSDMVYVVARLKYESGKILPAYFSTFEYSKVARNVGLNPIAGCHDIPTFLLNSARLPTPFFKEIIEYVQLFIRQFGIPVEGQHEMITSRFLESVSIPRRHHPPVIPCVNDTNTSFSSLILPSLNFTPSSRTAWSLLFHLVLLQRARGTSHIVSKRFKLILSSWSKHYHASKLPTND